MALNTYSTGTISVTAGGAVTVAGGIWTGPNVVAGDMISIDGAPALLINDVTDATHGQLVGWSGGAVSGKSYVVYKCSSLRFDDVQMAEDAKDIVAAFNTEGFYHFVPPDATGPDPSLGDDGQYAFQAGTGKLWEKTGGVWGFVGVYKGITPRGPWDGGTAYAVNDVVSRNGDAFMAISANTNSAPPSADWMALGAKGDAATVVVNSTSTGAPGSSAVVTNVGSSHAAQLNFTIPTGKGYGATSTSAQLIGTGEYGFEIETGRAYVAGDRVHIGATADPLNWMEGYVKSYVGSYLLVQVTDSDGSGVFNSWGIGLTGKAGLGDGDMKAAGNLSELTDKAVSRQNLEVPSLDENLGFYATLALEQVESTSPGYMVAGPAGGGLFDGFTALDFVDTANAVNLDTSVAGELRAMTPPSIAFSTTTTGNSPGWAGTNLRFFIPASLVVYYGSKVRLKLIGPTSGADTVISRMYVGHWGNHDPITDAWNFDGDQKIVTFGGYGSVSIPAGGDATSDWIDFNLDDDRDLIVSMYIASGDLRVRASGGSGLHFYYKEGSDEASDDVVSGYSDSGSYEFGVVYEVESSSHGALTVKSSNLALAESPDWARLYAIVGLGDGVMNDTIEIAAARYNDSADFVTATMTLMHSRLDGSKVYGSGKIDLTGTTAGTDGRWRITTNAPVDPRFLAIGAMFGVD